LLLTLFFFFFFFLDICYVWFRCSLLFSVCNLCCLPLVILVKEKLRTGKKEYSFGAKFKNFLNIDKDIRIRSRFAVKKRVFSNSIYQYKKWKTVDDR